MTNNEIKKNIEEARERIRDVFGYWEIEELVNDILDRIDPEEEEFEDEIYSCIDSATIYIEDQWKIIHHYINPAEVGSRGWFDIIEEFANDIKRLFEEV